MTTLSGFTRPSPPVGPDLASKLATATGLVITDAGVTPTEAIVTGTISESNRTAIQTAMNAYVQDPTFGLTMKGAFTLNGVPVATWTNQPAALTELPNSRLRVPLYGCSFARMTTNVAVAGFAGAVVKVRVSIDNGASWQDGPSIDISTTGFKTSSLVAIPPAFQVDVLAALWGQGGNAVADPAFGLTSLQIA